MKNIKKFIAPILIVIVSLGVKPLIFDVWNLGEPYLYYLNKISSISLIIGLSWGAITTLKILKREYLEDYKIDTEDNLNARKRLTQFNILERIIIFIIILIGVAATLMLFEEVRKIGVSLFASAGVAGIILGFAAQKAIGTILAGLQIAVSQPIRIDDVVIVEGEWGRVEEIKLTYVVIKIWDKRRLVVPTTYFIEKPFQNWTRTNADILGTVYLYTDYNIDFDALRDELTRLLENHELWDGQVNVLQVTDSDENHVEIRALMSARNSPQAWDLRVYVREHLIRFIQNNYPDALVKTRVTIKNKD
ncbi:mechanosensitive ion channel family protein [Robertkochia aurantiaca]|uniref:mechanosensitive ion channel family protein n=1 Tax=Robertkochia aurantiaca TaxID=2873700 RepID=UPI001CCE59C2|nr:mechanosensitive ion channel domain-containing protein [Robertkochia sp. 3YJGBD-33]